MALSARELLLIMRAQNQASGALRRLANDMRGLGRIQELQLRRNAMAIQQASLMRQRQRALNELDSVTRGKRFLEVQRARTGILDKQIRTTNALKNAEERRRIIREKIGILEARGFTKESLRMKQLQLQSRVQFRAIKNAKMGLESIAPALAINDARMGSLAQRASLLNNELSILNQRNAELAKRVRTVNREISAARWDKAVFGARAMAHAGRIAQLAGLGLGAAVGFAADRAAKFETSVRLVATQTGRAGSGIKTLLRNTEQLGPIILSVMKDSQASTDQLTQSTYNLFSSVDSLKRSYLTLADGHKLLKLANEASIAGQTDLEVSTMGIIRTMNTFGIGIGGMRKAMDRAFAAVRFGEFTFAQYNDALKTTAPAARQFTQTHSEMAGSLAFLSRRLGVQRAAIGYARALEILGDEKFGKEMKEQGVQIRNARNEMLPLPRVIENITRKFPGLRTGTRDIEEFFKTFAGRRGFIQARRALVFLFQQQREYSEMVKRVSNDNVEFGRSLTAMQQTAGVRWEKFLNRLRVLFLQFGTAALPAVLDLVKPIEDLVNWFEKLDESTQKQIGRWAVFGAAGLLIGGTLAAIVGTLGAMIATLGRLGILFKSTTVLIIATAAIVKALTGDFDLLGDSASRAMDFMTGSWQGFLIGAALASVAVIKLRNSLIGLQLAMAIGRGGTAAAAGAGFLPMLIGRSRNAKAGIQLMGQAAKQGSKVGAIFRTAAVGAALLPGPLKLAAGAIALFGVGALLWNRRADEMKKKAAELAAEQKALADAISTANAAAGRFATLGGGVRDFKRAKLDVQDINAQIKELRGTLKAADRDDRGGIRRQIKRLILDRSDAYLVMGDSAKRATNALRGFNAFMLRQANIIDMVGRKQGEIRTLTKELNDELARPPRRVTGPKGGTTVVPGFDPNRIQEIRDRINQLNADIGRLRAGSQEASGTMVRAFTTAVRELQGMGELPKKISPNMIKDALALQTHLGRVLSRKEMRLVFKAMVDKKSMRDLPSQISRFLRGQRKQRVEVEAKIKLARDALTRMEGAEQARKGLSFDAQLNQQKAKKDVENFRGWFEANKNLPPFRASVTPSGTSLGVALAQGIQAGMSSVSLSKTINIQINKAITATRQNQGIESPSKKWAKLVGLPIGQGIIVGMLKAMNSISSEFKKGSPKWRNDIRKQLREAFGDAAEQAGQDMLSRTQSLRDSLRSTFFEGIGELSEFRMEWGTALNVKELTANLREQTANLRGFSRDWQTLIGRKVPIKLLMQLSEMGEEGAAIMDALASGSRTDLAAYVRAWRQGEKLLNSVSRRQMRDQIKAWRRMGRSIAFGIMAGLRDEEQGLLNYFKRLFRRMFKQAVNFNKSRSPSKRYEAEGRNIVSGLKRGLDSGYGVNVPMPRVSPIGAGVRMAGAGGGGINMTVNAHHSESLTTAMERARFRLKYRR